MNPNKEPSFPFILNRLDKAFPEYDVNWIIKKIVKLDEHNKMAAQGIPGWHNPPWIRPKEKTKHVKGSADV